MQRTHEKKTNIEISRVMQTVIKSVISIHYKQWTKRC